MTDPRIDALWLLIEECNKSLAIIAKDRARLEAEYRDIISRRIGYQKQLNQIDQIEQGAQ